MPQVLPFGDHVGVQIDADDRHVVLGEFVRHQAANPAQTADDGVALQWRDLVFCIAPAQPVGAQECNPVPQPVNGLRASCHQQGG